MSVPILNHTLMPILPDKIQPTIGIVACYFGPLPKFMRPFLGTCATNSTVDFHFVSDSEPPPGLPANVKWHRMSLKDVEGMASQSLGFEAQIKRAYKLCDYKPTYGMVFESFLGSYDFWGYCDIDLVWGDIRSFLTPEVLADADVLSFRGKHWLTGAFTLFRNVPPVTRLFECAPNYQEVLQDTKHWSFCEVGRRFQKSENYNTISELVAAGQVVSMTDVVRDAAIKGEIRYKHPYVISEPSYRFRRLKYFDLEIEWANGHLLDLNQDREYILCHFVHMKKEPFFQIPQWEPFPDSFAIVPMGLTKISRRHGFRRRVESAARVAGAAPALTKWVLQRVRG